MSADGPRISIVVPAHNQRERLARTLESIARCAFDLRQVEVIVADDGSSDGTADWVAGAASSFPFPLVLRRGAWGNQSAATNEGLRSARGTIVLFSAQDILFREDLLAQHVAWHERFAGQEVAVLGELPYPPDLEVSPFMFYLVNGGYQFAYYLIKDPRRVPPNFVYAPNVSVRADTLRRVGGFDEELPYGCQDTDLGIRLDAAGVRIVFNPDAVGYHNHPITLDEFCSRQGRVAAGLVRLREKHPDHGEGVTLWDVVVRGLLAYGRSKLDFDRAEIARLEPALAARGDYARLWSRAFSQQESTARFAEAEQATLRRADELFNAYDRVLRHHLARGLMDEGLRRLGAGRLEAILRARLTAVQASLPVRRVLARRMAEHGLHAAAPDAADVLSARIVHDLASYEDVLRFLDLYQLPRALAFNQALVLLLDPSRFSAGELAAIEEMADVVACTSVGAGVREALERVTAELVVVASGRMAVEETTCLVVAEKAFASFPTVAVLGGAVAETDQRRWRYGYGFAPGRRIEALRRSMDGAPGVPEPIGAAVPEYMVLRRSAALAALGGAGLGDDWHVELCRRVAARKGLVLHVPAFQVCPRDASLAVPTNA